MSQAGDSLNKYSLRFHKGTPSKSEVVHEMFFFAKNDVEAGKKRDKIQKEVLFDFDFAIICINKYLAPLRDNYMKIAVDFHTIKAGKRNNTSNPITAAFYAIRYAIGKSHHDYVEPEEADVVFVFGSITSRKPNTERAQRIQRWRDEGKIIFSLDSSFFSTYIRNRIDSSETMMFRVGLHDCTGLGDFLNENSTNERYEWFKRAFGFREKAPRIQPEAPILFILQSEKGWQYDNSEPFYLWARGVLEQLRKLTPRHIILRAHPNTDRHPTERIAEGFDNVSITHAERGRRTLFDDLDRCGAVVTHSSSSTVESYVEGIPTFALDERCVNYKDLDHDLAKINEPALYNWYNREQKLANWAMTSWHVDEMKDPRWLEYYLGKIK